MGTDRGDTIRCAALSLVHIYPACAAQQPEQNHRNFSDVARA
jgi:hypothetical protein